MFHSSENRSNKTTTKRRCSEYV